MRWLADECVDAGLIGKLRGAGHDVVAMAEVASGSTDARVLQHAHSEERLLLTEDKDFGELIFRLKMPASGLVLIRIDPEKRFIKWQRLEVAIEKFAQDLFGRYIVIEEARLRSRPLLIRE